MGHLGTIAREKRSERKSPGQTLVGNPHLFPRLSPGGPAHVHVHCPGVPGDGGSLWEELMGFVGEPTEDTPTVDEPVAYRVGTLNPDDTYTPRDREDVQDDARNHELEQYRKEAEAQRLEYEAQRQSRYTLRSHGFVFTDEGASLSEEIGFEVQYDEQPAPERMFDLVPPRPGAFIPPYFIYGRPEL